MNTLTGAIKTVLLIIFLYLFITGGLLKLIIFMLMVSIMGIIGLISYYLEDTTTFIILGLPALLVIGVLFVILSLLFDAFWGL